MRNNLSIDSLLASPIPAAMTMIFALGHITYLYAELKIIAYFCSQVPFLSKNEPPLLKSWLRACENLH